MFLIEDPKWRMLLLFIISFLACWFIFRPILSIAKSRNLTDNPEARKLQKQPVPVLGGVAVFFGIMVGLGFFKTMQAYTTLFPVITAMVVMLYIGVMDDLKGLDAKLRFLLEILVAVVLIYGNHFYINNFQGLWGVETVGKSFGIILSVITFVGVSNAINMIDGIDGLSSGLCFLICFLFFLLFFFAHDYSYAGLAVISMGAIVPFFLHNVFGWSSKMFIGDGGTMVMGTLISAMIFEVLRGNFGKTLTEFTSLESCSLPTFDFSLIAFCVAVLSVPVADTLRVMSERIIRHKSPFSPDNRHLHHLFVKNGFSFISISIFEILLDLLTVAIFLLSWRLGASLEWQLYITVLFAASANIFFAQILRAALRHPDSFVGRVVGWKASRSHVERKGLWLRIQKLVDGEKSDSDA